MKLSILEPDHQARGGSYKFGALSICRGTVIALLMVEPRHASEQGNIEKPR